MKCCKKYRIGRRIKYCKIILSAVLAFVMLLFVASPSVLAEDQAVQTRKKVRVGFPTQPGLTEKDSEGNYTGYTVDYLEQLSKYIDWDIEYVEVKGSLNTQLVELLNMLENGEIDILGAMNYSEVLENIYLYPSYNYGTAYTVIAVREGESKWQEDDFQNWDKLRIATYPGMKQRVALLEKFADVSGFKYDIVEFDSYEDCLGAVQEGKADGVLQVDISMSDGLRPIARFSPSPYYLAVSRKNPILLRDLNTGMYNLLQSYPSLQTELYNKYFTKKGSFYITDDEKQWLSTLGGQSILFFEGNMPVQDMGDNGAGDGIAKSFFDELRKQTGLELRYVIASDYQEGLQYIRDGKVNIVAAVPGDAALTSEANLRLSLPYFQSNGVIVSGSDKARLDKENVQLLSANVEKLMTTLNHSPDKAAMVDAYCVNYYMHKGELFKNISVDWSASSQIMYSVGFTRNANDRLIEIINRYIKCMTDDQIQQMVYVNSSQRPRYTFSEFFYVYRWIIGLVLMTIVLFSFVYFFFKKNQELRKSKTESERLYQFSKMTEECLFEYDYKRDRLILQNNRVMFPHEHMVNQFHKTMFSYKYHSRNEETCVKLLLEMLEKKEERRNFPLFEDGMEVWYKMTIVFIDGSYAIGRIVDDNQDIRERKELEKRARTDQLTGLMNRAALEKNVSEYIKVGNQDGVYLLMDLDNFKRINDSLGHREGDRLLCKFAAELEQSFRGTDLKARLGGDEFVVFMPGKIEEIRLIEKLDSFVEYVAKEVFDEYKEYGVTVSIGAAYIGSRAYSAETLYREADSAMYVAKFGGKNDFFISDGVVCMRRYCTNCREECRQKEYLKQRGVYRLSEHPEEEQDGFDRDYDMEWGRGSSGENEKRDGQSDGDVEKNEGLLQNTGGTAGEE